MSHGPWAAALVSAIVGAAPEEPAESPVEGLEVVEGTARARVGACDVTLEAELVPQRLWAAMWRFARGNGPLEAAAEGREQSEHLEHLLREDWDVALIPDDLSVACSCDGAVRCAHAAAVGHAFADAVDAEPALLLRWRGCTPERARIVHELDDDEDEPALAPAADWEAGALPEPRPARPLPAGAVLKRLGPVGVRVGDGDLAEALQAAYDAFAATRDASPPPDD